MTAEQRQNRIITGFILLSLLLHLLLLLLPKHKLFPDTDIPEPVYVEVRPMQPRELDLPIRKELEKPRKKPAKRLAERDQVVEKEMAPAGKDTQDKQKVVRAPKPVPKTPPQTKPQPEPRAKTAPQETEPTKDIRETLEGWKLKPEKKPSPKTPDLQTLTQISPRTLEKIESDWRQKYRADVARGDTVWMDAQQDLLISFMRRFRDKIYNVWNYPIAARRQGQQGTLLVRITIDRKGNIADIEILESSGHRSLDDEVIRAVRKGATYGSLPRAYPNKELKIMAFFQYQLGSSNTWSYRRRPGAIY